MKIFEHVVTNEIGLHARPAAELVKKIKGYASEVEIQKEAKFVKGPRLLALIGLEIKQGDRITVCVSGPDEETVAEDLKAFLKENL